MPSRQIPLVTGEIYHTFNRGIDNRITFTNKREYKRALEIIRFYQFASPPLKLSRFLTLSTEDKERITSQLNALPKLVNVISFCLMPNHFHFLLQQMVDNGISRFLSQLQNSYTRYFNTKHERVGPLFLDQFKAVRIETNEQLLHVSRYIHLNPYSSFVVKTIKELITHRWSSLPEYLFPEKEKLCDKTLVLSQFKNKGAYEKFIFDQADYQRKLDVIKHLFIDEK